MSAALETVTNAANEGRLEHDDGAFLDVYVPFAAEVFGKVDLLATPTIPTCLPTLAETDIDHGPPGTEQRFMALSVNTRPFNYLGLPAASAPCGLDPNGLPIGLQIAGRPFAEARVLKAVDAYQRDTDWHRWRPPVVPA